MPSSLAASEQLLDAFREHGIVPRIPDVVAFANANQVVLLTHDASGVDVDLSIAWLPFEIEALAASERLEIAGTPVRVARAEDLIIYKAVAFRPPDQQDIERLLVLHRADLDLSRIRRVVGVFFRASCPSRCNAFAVSINHEGRCRDSHDRREVFQGFVSFAAQRLRGFYQPRRSLSRRPRWARSLQPHWTSRSGWTVSTTSFDVASCIKRNSARQTPAKRARIGIAWSLRCLVERL